LTRSPARWGTLLSLSLATVLLISGCKNQESDKDVMAKVNGYKVLRSEVDKNYKRQIAGSPQKLSSEQDQMLRLQLLQQIINRQLYLQKAEKMGVVVTDDEVETKFNEFKAPYTKEEFAKKMQESGLSEDENKQELRRDLTIEKLLNKEVGSKVTISDADIQNYYNEHKAQFNVIEPQYYLAHIFVSAQPNVPSPNIPGKAQNEGQARDKIKMIYNLLESGDDFATVAAKYSEDLDTARSGGELGASPESQIKNADAATREAVLKLKPGQYSQPVQIANPATQKTLGFRIVKLLGRDAAGQRDANDPKVQQLIRTQLRNQREQFLRAAYDEVVHDSADIDIYYASQIIKDAGLK